MGSLTLPICSASRRRQQFIQKIPEPKENLKALQSENRTLQAQLQKLQIENTTVRRIFSRQYEKLKLLKEEKNHNEQLQYGSQDNDQSSKKLIDSQKEEIRGLKSLIDDIRQKYDCMAADLKKEQDKSHKLEKDFLESSEKLIERNEILRKLEDDFKNEKNRCRDKICELIKLKKDFEQQDSELKKAKQLIARKEGEIERCEVVMSRQRQREKELEERTKKSLEIQLKNDADIINGLENYIQEMDKKVKKLEGQLGQYEMWLDGPTNLLDSIPEVLLQKHERIKGIYQEKMKLEGRIGGMKGKILLLENQIKNLLDNQRERVQEFFDDKKQLEIKLKVLENKHSCQNDLVDKQTKYIEELEGQVELLVPALEENKSLMKRLEELEGQSKSLNLILEENKNLLRKVEETACQNSKQEEQLKEASEILREQQRIISDHQTVLATMEGMHKNEKSLLEEIVRKKKEQIEYLVGERVKVLRFVEGIKVLSEFIEDENQPILSQLEGLEAHVQKRLEIVHKFCEMISKTAEVLPPPPPQLQTNIALRSFSLPLGSVSSLPANNGDTPPVTPELVQPPFPPQNSETRLGNMQGERQDQSDCLQTVKKTVMKKRKLPKRLRRFPRKKFGPVVKPVLEFPFLTAKQAETCSVAANYASKAATEDDIEIIDLSD